MVIVEFEFMLFYYFRTANNLIFGNIGIYMYIYIYRPKLPSSWITGVRYSSLYIIYIYIYIYIYMADKHIRLKTWKVASKSFSQSLTCQVSQWVLCDWLRGLTPQHCHWYATTRFVCPEGSYTWVDYSRQRTQSCPVGTVIFACWRLADAHDVSNGNARDANSNPRPLDPKESVLPKTPQRSTHLKLIVDLKLECCSATPDLLVAKASNQLLWAERVISGSMQSFLGNSSFTSQNVIIHSFLNYTVEFVIQHSSWWNVKCELHAFIVMSRVLHVWF